MTGPAAGDRSAVRALVVHTFDRAADLFDDDALFFWAPCGRRTVELAGVRPGDTVLDVCCGTGASALPAAVAAGPDGFVTGVDLAGRPLERARAKAARLGLTNTAFVRGDLEAPDVPAPVDVAVCVFGLYFARDPAAALAGLAAVVRPGGTVAVTTWGRRALEPGLSHLRDAVAAERPDLRATVPSWERLAGPYRLRRVFAAAGLPAPAIERETLRRPLDPGTFRTIVLGSGFRLLLDVLDPAAADRVQADLARRIEADDAGSLCADVLYARSTVP